MRERERERERERDRQTDSVCVCVCVCECVIECDEAQRHPQPANTVPGLFKCQTEMPYKVFPDAMGQHSCFVSSVQVLQVKRGMG